jgi:hypothetical protein
MNITESVRFVEEQPQAFRNMYLDAERASAARDAHVEAVRTSLRRNPAEVRPTGRHLRELPRRVCYRS